MVLFIYNGKCKGESKRKGKNMRDFVKMVQDELDEFVDWVERTQDFDSKDEEIEYIEERFWSRTADEYGLEYSFDENLVVGLI